MHNPNPSDTRQQEWPTISGNQWFGKAPARPIFFFYFILAKSQSSNYKISTGSRGSGQNGWLNSADFVVSTLRIILSKRML